MNANGDNRTEDEIWATVPESLDPWLPKKYTFEEWEKIIERTINTGEVQKAPQSDLENPFAKKPDVAPATTAPATNAVPAPTAPTAPATATAPVAPTAPDKPVVSDENNVEEDDLMKELNSIKTEVGENSDEIPF
jgi:hypothetical protein